MLVLVPIWDENAKDYQTLKQVMSAFPIFCITIDVANAYHESFVDFVTKIRTEYPRKSYHCWQCSNINMTEELIIKGADIVKLELVPGSVCTQGRRQVLVCQCFSNNGMSQMPSMVLVDISLQMVVAQNPGDVAKALGGGAHFVMLGGMLAGHNESELELKDGKRIFYGMAPNRALDTHGQRKDGYRGTEGKTVTLNDKGPGQRHC